MQTTKLITKPAKIWRHNYSCLTDLVEAAMQPADDIPDMYRRSRTKENDEWAGGTFEDTVQHATYGWSEGFKRILELTKKYKNHFDDVFPRQDYQKQVTNDVEGEAIDIGLALQGVPESMITTTEDITTKIIPGNKLQRVFYQNSFSCFINKETIFHYGAMICCLVNAMEGHGFRTEVITRALICDNHEVKPGQDKLAIFDTRIKKFEDSPDYNSLAFVFASSCYLRRLIFSVKEQQDEEYRKTFGVPDAGYGYPCNYKEDLVEATDIYIPYIENNISFEQIAAGFRQILEIHFKEQK